MQLIPYGTFTGARFLDRTTLAFASDAGGRGGVDAKVVVRDAVTLDFTVNPDFSQVESDEPQVTVNQRFEVFFPEKRPFFLENANYFQTPINLFFSRRICDPQFGARSTGKLGGWAVGALFTSRDFGPSANRIAALDSRLRPNSRWIVTGHAAFSDTTTMVGAGLESTAYSEALDKAGRKFTYSLNYTDVGAEFVAPLGFVPRADIRQGLSFATLRWRPKNSPIVAIGPNSFVQYTWDRSGAYVGVTDGYDSIALDPVGGLRPIRNPTTSTGRQFFIKTSYLFRF